MRELSCSVELDEITVDICKMFDYEFTGKSEFQAPPLPKIPDDFSIGLLVGRSGTGKTTLLDTFGRMTEFTWKKNFSVVSHFESSEDAKDRLFAVGLNSIPSWVKPYHVLSTGEKFRADLAIRLRSGCVIDEFTSVVDRDIAKSCSHAVRRYVDQKQLKNVVFATCHEDIIEWLRPDWVFNTNTSEMHINRNSKKPTIHLKVKECTWREWDMFSKHHYLSGTINKASRCFIGEWEGVPVAFHAALRLPNGNFDNGWRGHRTVVLPEFQGLGIGISFTNEIARMFVDSGYRFFSKTSHPRLGEYRNNSSLWKPTSKNKVMRTDYKGSINRGLKNWLLTSNSVPTHARRLCYSHEYIGGDVSNESIQVELDLNSNQSNSTSSWTPFTKWE